MQAGRPLPASLARPGRSGWWVQLVGIAVLLGLWALVTEVLKIWPPYVMPGPGLVWQEFVYGFTGSGPDGKLGLAVLNSLRRVLIGYAVAVALGLLLGAVLAASRPLRETVGGWLTAVQSIPSIAFVPLAILWFGLNERAVLFVVILEGFIPVALSVSSALLNVPPALRIAGRTLGARGGRLYTQVLLPAALPSLASGLRVAWSFAWRALIGAELLTSNPGLGQVLETGRNISNTALVIASMIIVGALGSLFDLLLRRFEARVRRNYGLEGST
ncbi:NitT/TauT family transport system permease protein [Deinobacterium chartae]|uniref:NitT/TauT family transport system permease protein n=1 Tax=Deinobacterium chartae TaxID=521158 RepID=A0A841HYL4_9DEIO|nr:ABC transporter permease [Deinobacterium chartae]MBB6097983.1 NitT/TauT family transport system permease protein [Deinobacterium chartae]